MEQEPAVAFEQHDLARGSAGAQPRPQAYDRPLPTAPNSRTVVALRRPATHLGVEIGLMAAADDDVSP
jgi:hypothetical protein